METKVGAAPIALSFDDFEPYCNWQRDEGIDTIVIHLSEFKRNQLKIQINNSGILTISGERPINETKWSRFSKQINLAKNINTSEIRAKFVGGLLYLTMPKKNALVATHDQQQQPTTSVDQQPSKEVEKPKPETSQEKMPGKPQVHNLVNAAETTTSYKFLQETLGRMSRMNKVAVSLAVAAAALVAIGAYLKYK